MIRKERAVHYFLIFCLLVICCLLQSALVVCGQARISTTEDFIAQVEQEYSQIEKLTATVEMLGVSPALTIKIWAITDTKLLRLEYLEPQQMKGQFFLLKEDFLYQYMPARDLIIKKDLTQANIPVKAANLTPDYLMELIHSEELEVKLVGRPMSLEFSVMDLMDVSKTKLENGDYSFTPLKSEGTGKVADLYVTMARSGLLLSHYVLDIVPRVAKYQFARQIIVFDPHTYLPTELVTYLPEEPEKPVRTKVLESSATATFDSETIKELPKSAEIISG